jgi:phage terminase large subunit-like protein
LAADKLDAFLARISAGSSMPQACLESGVGKSTISELLTLGRDLKSRHAEGENQRASDFLLAYEAALGHRESRKRGDGASDDGATDPAVLLDLARRTLDAAYLIGWTHPDGPEPEGVDLSELQRRADDACREHLLPYLVATYDGDRPFFEVSWHHLLFAACFEWCLTGVGNRFMGSLPTRMGKSLIARGAVAWYLGRYPTDAVMSGSYGDELAGEGSQAVKDLVGSAAHSRIFPESRLPTATEARAGGIKVKGHYWKLANKKGSYQGAAIASGVSGFPACLLGTDDPVKDMDTANSPISQKKLFSTWLSQWRRRQQGRRNAFIITTRWGEKDLPGQLLKLAAEDPAADQWLEINLPDILEGVPPPWDPRAPGEYIWPGAYRLPWEQPSPEEESDRLEKCRKVVAALPVLLAKLSLQTPGVVDFEVVKGRALADARAKELADPDAYHAMDRGKPRSLKGSRILGEWLTRRYTEAPADTEWFIFVDAKRLDMKGSQDPRSSYMVANGYGRSRGEYYLRGERRGQFGFTDSCMAVRELFAESPGCKQVRIENKAAGKAMMISLSQPYTDAQGKTWPALPVALQEIEGTKMVRFVRVEHLLSSARSLLLLPSARLGWIADWIAELLNFQDRPHEINDRVDVLTLALAFLSKPSVAVEYRHGPKRESAGWAR